MNSSEAQRYTVISGVVTLASVVGGQVLPTEYGGKGQIPEPSIIVGLSAGYLGISIICEVAPKVGAMLAVAMAVTAYRLYGSDLLTAYFVKGPGAAQFKVKKKD